jgi:predicted metalloendopeptidase
MLITFKSKAAADVVMYKEHAKRILDLLGKDVERGVITAAETASAVARLETEIAERRAHSVSDDVNTDVQAHHGAAGDDNEHEPSQPVSFATRAYPLLEMLRAAQRGNHVVAWGI